MFIFIFNICICIDICFCICILAVFPHLLPFNFKPACCIKTQNYLSIHYILIKEKYPHCSSLLLYILTLVENQRQKYEGKLDDTCSVFSLLVEKQVFHAVLKPLTPKAASPEIKFYLSRKSYQCLHFNDQSQNLLKVFGNSPWFGVIIKWSITDKDNQNEWSKLFG